MGSMFVAQCSCGFESDELLLGGGMMNFTEVCEIAFYCDNCEIVGTINFLTKEGKKGYYRCTKCKKRVKYYGEIEENTFKYQEEYLFDWRINNDKRYFLQDKLHYCPKCKKVNLKFYSTGCWD